MTARDGRWPDPVQRLAVQAAVAEPEVARAAWQELTGRVDLEDLWDAEVYRLLPLVWHHLGAEVGAEHVDRLKGLYRKSWVQNQHHLRNAADAVTHFGEAGIDVLVLKGLPVALCFLGDLGARPMGDVDLLVRPDQVTAAWRTLEQLGYRSESVRGHHPSRWEQEGDDDWYLRLRHARGYRRGPLDALDVHSTLSLDFVSADPAVADTTAFWADARPLDLGGVPAQTLSPSHHLFHAIVHGLGSTGEAVLRWVPDALTILQAAADDLDWDAFVAAARRHHCTLLVSEGVGYLVEAWDAEIPETVRAELASGPADRREHTLRWIRRRSGQPLVGTGYAAGVFVTSTRGLGPLGTAARAPGFLADHWQVAHVRHVPLVLGHKVREQLRARGRTRSS